MLKLIQKGGGDCLSSKNSISIVGNNDETRATRKKTSSGAKNMLYKEANDGHIETVQRGPFKKRASKINELMKGQR